MDKTNHHYHDTQQFTSHVHNTITSVNQILFPMRFYSIIFLNRNVTVSISVSVAKESLVVFVVFLCLSHCLLLFLFRHYGFQESDNAHRHASNYHKMDVNEKKWNFTIPLVSVCAEIQHIACSNDIRHIQFLYETWFYNFLDQDGSQTMTVHNWQHRNTMRSAMRMLLNTNRPETIQASRQMRRIYGKPLTYEILFSPLNHTNATRPEMVQYAKHTVNWLSSCND